MMSLTTPTTPTTPNEVVIDIINPLSLDRQYLQNFQSFQIFQNFKISKTLRKEWRDRMDNSDDLIKSKLSSLEKIIEQTIPGGKESVEIMESIAPLVGQVKALISKTLISKGHHNEASTGDVWLSVFFMTLYFLMHPLSVDSEIRLMEVFLANLRSIKEEESKEKEKLH